MRRRASKLLFEPGDVSAAPSVLRVRPAPPPPTGPGPEDEAALDLEPRELWIAAHVPQLSLLALPAGSSAAPLVVLDEAIAIRASSTRMPGRRQREYVPA